MGRVIYKIAETEDELKGYFAVRKTVFVDEQKLFSDSDVDEHDACAIHIVALDEDRGEVIGAVRCYEESDGVWIGGRLAVSKDARYRTISVGARLCIKAEKTVIENGCQRFLAYIQLKNIHFFERLGWKKVGEPVDHCGQPHQIMQASLER